MKEFIKNMLDSDSSTSSKRVAGILSLLTCIGLAIVATVKTGGITPDFMFNNILLFAAGVFSVTGMEKIFSKKDAKPVEEVKPVETVEDKKEVE